MTGYTAASRFADASRVDAAVPSARIIIPSSSAV